MCTIWQFDKKYPQIPRATWHYRAGDFASPLPSFSNGVYIKTNYKYKKWKKKKKKTDRPDNNVVVTLFASPADRRVEKSLKHGEKAFAFFLSVCLDSYNHDNLEEKVVKSFSCAEMFIYPMQRTD